MGTQFRKGSFVIKMYPLTKNSATIVLQDMQAPAYPICLIIHPGIIRHLRLPKRENCLGGTAESYFSYLPSSSY